MKSGPELTQEAESQNTQKHPLAIKNRALGCKKLSRHKKRIKQYLKQFFHFYSLHPLTSNTHNNDMARIRIFSFYSLESRDHANSVILVISYT